MNTLPSAGTDSATTEPPWVLATLFTIERPRPVPPDERLAASIDPVEPFEDPLEVCLRDPDAVVPHRDRDLVFGGRDHNLNNRVLTRIRVLQCIVEEIRHRRNQLFDIPVHHGVAQGRCRYR